MKRLFSSNNDEFTYAPWMTANLWMKSLPESKGFETAWDNVIYKSPSLGYVVATHQSLDIYNPKPVWTYYHPFTKGEPSDQRQWMLNQKWEDWQKLILSDLRYAHADIEKCVERIDVMLWGHGMIRPVPGFIWGGARERAKKNHDRIIYAHSDLSGISIFEEAFYQGCRAANHFLKI